MTSKRDTIRAFGQRSISSAIFSPSPDSVKSSKSDVRDSKPSVTLSNFLDRKLHKISALPRKTPVQYKLRPFSTPAGSTVANDVQSGNEVKLQEVGNGATGTVIFDLFKISDLEKGSAVSCNLWEDVNSQEDTEVQLSRKRSNPFRGGDESQKQVVVLGAGPKPKPRSNGNEDGVKDKKPRHVFNHYGNGGGFWDSNMAGVDSDQVGSSELWEGVGSTTLGGLEWD